MFKDKSQHELKTYSTSLSEDNSKLMNLIDALENKDAYLYLMHIRLCASIAILSIMYIASIICIIIRPDLIVPILPITALVYLLTSIILIRCRVIDVDHVVIIGVIYVLVYLCVSCMLINGVINIQ